MTRFEQRMEAAKEYVNAHKDTCDGLSYLTHMDATEWADRTAYDYIHKWLKLKVEQGYDALGVLRSFEWDYPDKVLK